MEDPKDKLQSTGTGHKIGLPKLHQKLQAAQAAAKVAPKEDNIANVMPNRIGLIIDLSGSMNDTNDTEDVEDYGDPNAKSKVEHLKDALCGFINSSNPLDTAIAIESFPTAYLGDESEESVEFSNSLLTIQRGISQCLTNVPASLITKVQFLNASGDTPMGAAMHRMLHRHPITHAVMVSDGEATDGELSYEVASNYVEAGVKIDCVHIGSTTKGEARLKKIAELTGGIYIKFTDVSSFGSAFKFLSGSLRGILAQYSETEVAKLLGASEVKK